MRYEAPAARLGSNGAFRSIENSWEYGLQSHAILYARVLPFECAHLDIVRNSWCALHFVSRPLAKCKRNRSDRRINVSIIIIDMAAIEFRSAIIGWETELQSTAEWKMCGPAVYPTGSPHVATGEKERAMVMVGGNANWEIQRLLYRKTHMEFTTQR